MKARKPQPLPSAGDFEPNNGQNYAKRAVAFGRARGYAEEAWPVVSDGTSEFDAWMEYFAHIGSRHGRPRSFARLRGKITVPALSPDEFEPGWRSREPVPFPKAEATHRERWIETLSDEECAISRDRVAQLVREFKRVVAASKISVREAAE